jgi:hypothetical protein
MYTVQSGQLPIMTLKVSQGQPNINQVRSMDHRTFLPNYIEIRLVVFSEPRSQEIHGAGPAYTAAAGSFKIILKHIQCELHRANNINRQTIS